jgi:hypothetical protein
MAKRVVVVVDNDHAEFQHGNSAKHARRAIQEWGVENAYQEPDGTIHLITNSRYDGHYDQVVRRGNDGKLHEVTAFQPKNGVVANIFNWLTGKKAKKISLDQL